MGKRFSEVSGKSGGVSELNNNNIVHTINEKEYKALGYKKKKESKKCHECIYNENGYCAEYKKWAHMVRDKCNRRKVQYGSNRNEASQFSNSNNRTAENDYKEQTFHRQSRVSVVKTEWDNRAISGILYSKKNVYWILLEPENIINRKNNKLTAVLIYNEYIRYFSYNRDDRNYSEFLAHEIMSIIKNIKFEKVMVNVIVNGDANFGEKEKIMIEDSTFSKQIKVKIFIKKKEIICIDDILRFSEIKFKLV